MLGQSLAGGTHWGAYHLTTAGQTTWHGFATAIFDGAERRGHVVPAVERISTAEYGAPAPRPAYSVLDTALARRRFGLALPDWRDALERVLDARLGPAGRPAPASR
jgi:dTDP-4-dehydrorhamnose reductase